MIDAPLAFAFSAGMVATVNPCGIAMLPAYLSYFLGAEDEQTPDGSSRAVRALVVGATVSFGFLAVFALAGAAVSWTSIGVGEISPWLTVGIGLVLAGGGITMVAGWQPKLAGPRLDRGGRTTNVGSMFLFGISYAVASLSCTIGPFVAVVATTFSRTSFASGMATFGSYAAGMTLLLMVLTVSLAMARSTFLGRLRAALPYVQRISGVVMAAMGAYLAWYGVYAIRLISRGDTSAQQGPIGFMTRWSSTTSSWISRFDPITVGTLLLLFILMVLFVRLWRAGRPNSFISDDGQEAS